MAALARSSVSRFLARGGGSRRARVSATGRGELDDRVLRKRLREWTRASGRSIPEGLNKAARNTAFRAIRKTKKTKVAQITADVGTPAEPKSLAYALYLKAHPGISLAGLRAKVSRMVRAKRASIAYIASGWLRALKAFSNTSKDVNPKSVAARGYGKKATEHRKMSEILNAAPGADEIGGVAMVEAAAEAHTDMMDYLARKQRDSARRFNR